MQKLFRLSFEWLKSCCIWYVVDLETKVPVRMGFPAQSEVLGLPFLFYIGPANRIGKSMSQRIFIRNSDNNMRINNVKGSKI